MQRDMSDVPLHIVYSLFDANQDGNLASAELVTVRALVPFCCLRAALLLPDCDTIKRRYLLALARHLVLLDCDLSDRKIFMTFDIRVTISWCSCD